MSKLDLGFLTVLFVRTTEEKGEKKSMIDNRLIQSWKLLTTVVTCFSVFYFTDRHSWWLQNPPPPSLNQEIKKEKNALYNPPPCSLHCSLQYIVNLITAQTGPFNNSYANIRITSRFINWWNVIKCSGRWGSPDDPPSAYHYWDFPGNLDMKY